MNIFHSIIVNRGGNIPHATIQTYLYAYVKIEADEK